MIDWGRTKFRQLKSLEKRIHDMLQDSSRNSLQLRPMSADQVSLSTIFATLFLYHVFFRGRWSMNYVYITI